MRPAESRSTLSIHGLSICVQVKDVGCWKVAKRNVIGAWARDTSGAPAIAAAAAWVKVLLVSMWTPAGSSATRERRDHVQFDARAGRGQLVDADGGAGRLPVAEVLRHHRDHAVLVAHVGEVLGHLDHVGPGQALV